MTICDRRTFLASTALVGAVQIVPRHVLGKGYVAPSDKVTVGCIGIGTQTLRELPQLLSSADVQVVAVCDPNKESTDYYDWSPDEIRGRLAELLEQPSWRAGTKGIAAGREVGRDAIETYYAKTQRSGTFTGCASYADFRELLEKERDLDAVKVMTPDHLHAAVAVAAMKKGKHVMMHKPLANRLAEARTVIETARQTKVATHFIPWDTNGVEDMKYVKGWIDDGAIGTLREIHNWSNRPVWPQYDAIPTDTPPVPPDFDWELWLGPEQSRPYSPKYTHMVFRGWYDFGGGAIADMGHYSLWTVFRSLNLGAPISAEPMLSHACAIKGSVSGPVRNDFSFPAACILRFRFPGQEGKAPLDLFWYDGSMRPTTPHELEADGRPMPGEGMMFVGDKGKILAGFRVEQPRLIPEKSWTEFKGPKPPMPEAERPAAPPDAARGASQGAASPAPRRRRFEAADRGLAEFVAACRGGAQPASSFLHAGPISEMMNLGAVALRAGTKVLYDPATMRITNVTEANRFLTRDYRKGWEMT
jgi:hypothetical protein